MIAQQFCHWFNNLDDSFQLALPVIIGLCISTPLMLIGDMTDYIYTVIILLPLMVGVVLSIIITFRGLRKDHVSILPSKEVMIGVCIGSIPLIIFVYYVIEMVS